MTVAMAPVPERDFRGPGCDERCVVVKALVPGRFGRSELLLHDPSPHEAFGRTVAETPPVAPVVRTGPLVVDLGAWTVSLAGESVHLTTNELRMLATLARRPGLLVEYAELTAAIWGSSELQMPPSGRLHLVRVNVSRLRAKLGPAGPLIATVPMIGLRLDVVRPGPDAPPGGYPRAVPPVKRWALRWDACRTCGRTTYPHNGRGLCSSCCGKERAILHGPKGWTHAWECCRDCGRSDRRHRGYGYCDACGKRRAKREKV